MWICVGTHDPSTKPSWGWLRVGVSKPQLILAGAETTANKVTTQTRAYCRGCIQPRPRRAFGKHLPAPRKPKGKPGRPFVGAHGGGSVFCWFWLVSWFWWGSVGFGWVRWVLAGFRPLFLGDVGLNIRLREF